MYDWVDALIVFIIAAVVVGVISLFGYFIWHDIHYDQQTWHCKTKDAQMINSTQDNNLHVTIWCVKNGVVVP